MNYSIYLKEESAGSLNKNKREASEPLSSEHNMKYKLLFTESGVAKASAYIEAEANNLAREMVNFAKSNGCQTRELCFNSYPSYFEISFENQTTHILAKAV